MYQEDSISPKITVGCRMSSELRKDLENEAFDLDMTLSAYVEYILSFRVRDRNIYEQHFDLINEYNELIEDYNELIEEYELDSEEEST